MLINSFFDWVLSVCLSVHYTFILIHLFHVPWTDRSPAFSTPAKYGHAFSIPAFSVAPFLPECDYVTFGSLLSQFRLSSVCLSVGLLRWCTLLNGLNLSAKYLHRCVPWPSSDLLAQFYGDRPRGTPPSGALNARRVAKYSDFRPIECYIS